MKTLLSLTFSIFLLSCSSTKFVKKPPFNVVDATYQNWYGGREGVRGISIKILVNDINADVKFDSLYFKDKKLKIFVTDIENTKLITANINTGYKPENLQMHTNPKKEYGNKLPKTKEKFPFDLKKNEAVLSYKKSGKTLFYKLTLKKKKDRYMP